MERRHRVARADWRRRVERLGLIWHSDGDSLYWDESVHYALSPADVGRIETATENVHALFVEAGAHMVRNPALMQHFGIPVYCHQAIADSWRHQPPALNVGRFDFGYDGSDEPKLFEFNCDTPTGMLEAAVVQWDWKEQCFPDHDQFNSLHDKLLARWRRLARSLPGRRAWFTHAADPSHEDTITTTYLRDLAEQAGIATRAILIGDIGIDEDGRIVDLDDYLISTIFKLYPWEWIVDERYGPEIVRNLPATLWIEPIWKMLWSNKAILELLWKLFPGHPNLLPASSTRDAIGDSHVAKPFLSREGANIRVVEAGKVIAQSEGNYAADRLLYQQRFRSDGFDGFHPVIGSWIVDGEAAGVGIREDGLITGNMARFVPHIIDG